MIERFCRDFAGGWQAELGAMRIPKQHQFTLEVAKRYNLTLKPFNNNPHRYHVFGKQLDKKKKDANSLNFFLDEFNVMDKKDRKGTCIIPKGSAAFVTSFPTLCSCI